MGAHRFEELEVFQRAYKLSLEVHRFTQTMPKVEQFDLASQIRRASKSICATGSVRICPLSPDFCCSETVGERSVGL